MALATIAAGCSSDPDRVQVGLGADADDIVDGTWDPPSGRSFDGYNLGPNQTDCDTYWILDSITDSLTVGRQWFQPGTNLNHDVYDSGHVCTSNQGHSRQVMLGKSFSNSSAP